MTLQKIYFLCVCVESAIIHYRSWQIWHLRISYVGSEPVHLNFVWAVYEQGGGMNKDIQRQTM